MSTVLFHTSAKLWAVLNNFDNKISQGVYMTSGPEDYESVVRNVARVIRQIQHVESKLILLGLFNLYSRRNFFVILNYD